jgi:hypothetical protein
VAQVGDETQRLDTIGQDSEHPLRRCANLHGRADLARVLGADIPLDQHSTVAQPCELGLRKRPIGVLSV